MEHFKQGGDAITKTDRAEMTEAVTALGHLNNKYSVNGANVSQTTDFNGGTGATTSDSSKNYSAGTNVKFNALDSLFGHNLKVNSSTVDIAVASVASSVAGTATSMAGGAMLKKVGSGLKNVTTKLNSSTSTNGGLVNVSKGAANSVNQPSYPLLTGSTSTTTKMNH